MKIYNIIIALLFMLFIGSCGNQYNTEDYFELEELGGYVAFDASGNDAYLDPFDVNESGGTVSMDVENPTGTISDIKVDYTFGGTAVYGEDFTDPNGSAAGGSITISSAVGDFNETYQAPIVLNLIDNDDFDNNEERTILVTLTGANNSEGSLLVGRGGKDFLKTAIVNIADDECDSEYAGSYSVETTTDTILIDGVLTDSTEMYTGTASLAKVDGDFFSYDVDDASGGFYASDFVGGGTLPVKFTEDCGTITAESITDSNGQGVTLLSGSVDDGGVITLSFKGDVTGNVFTSVFTPN